MSKLVKVFAAAIAAIAVVVLIYAVLTPQTTSTDSDHMGMWGGHMTYSSVNVGLIALSTVMIVAAIMVLMFWQEYEPLPPMVVAPAQQELARKVKPDEAQDSTQLAEGRLQPCPEDAAAKEYLILRLLTGDERTMFKALMDSGGEALQKDLIVRTRMSNAKVSRLLDKLEQKGVITKDRHGATNKIRIKPA